MRYVLTLLTALLAFTSCEEIPPVINPSGDGNPVFNTPVDEQKRQVLVEEFSGVKCVNCPAGSDAIQVLAGIYGEQLVAVSIHAGFFSTPYPENRYDFQTQSGYALLDYLGQPLGFPTAVINRKQFPGQDALQLNQREWAGAIAAELATAPKIKIDIRNTFDPIDSLLQVDVDLYIQERINEDDVRLSVLVMEDNIKDFQLTPEGKVGNYNHRHVFREMLTDFRGQRLTEPLLPGEKISKSFQMNIPKGWVVENCTVVAFVNLNGEKKEILQAHMAAI
ncbi:MAG: Omp28 family outer membrane lipoprotein [Saprospiraceae bacterium]|nr:Omp28 family outer membrane lipoprotein [Lewinella sp.]